MKSELNPQLRIINIPPEREGWVYLIHAVGTNRYKIGRTQNPVARYETLKKQSPYPLQIIDSMWTVDMVTDEAYLHQNLSNTRVHGEWFELPPSKFREHKSLFYGSENPLYASLTRWHLLRSSELFIGDLLATHGIESTPTSGLMSLYDDAPDSRESLEYIDKIVYNVILKTVDEFVDMFGLNLPVFLNGFLQGAGLKFTENRNDEEGQDDA